ncbi:MAG: hypothetical protein HY393_02190 [Candidatus Diapherotrites archaeon]|nr:hypothetical protein [Candidatus Diapherotrites archaeon]
MSETELKQISSKVDAIQKELHEFKELFEEAQFELNDETKAQIKESRNRAHSEFKSQKEMEKKFL